MTDATGSIGVAISARDIRVVARDLPPEIRRGRPVGRISGQRVSRAALLNRGIWVLACQPTWASSFGERFDCRPMNETLGQPQTTLVARRRVEVGP